MSNYDEDNKHDASRLGMRGNWQKVLDHGHVRLIDFMGSDLSIVRAARVSYNAAWRAGQDEGSDEKLIHYLMGARRKGKPHSTPFEAVTITLDIKAPIFVFRQWHRHRTQSYNEMSARYVELPEEYYLPDPRVVGEQSKSNKQGRQLGVTDLALREREVGWVDRHCKHAFQVYHDLIACNWPKELARMVLPFNTYSQMFTTMNLWNCFHFLSLRDDKHAQYEIREYAKAVLSLIQPIAPTAVAAFKEREAWLSN